MKKHLPTLVIILLMSLGPIMGWESHAYHNVDYETVQIAAGSREWLANTGWRPNYGDVYTNSEHFLDNQSFVHGKFHGGRIAGHTMGIKIDPDSMNWPYYCAKVDRPKHGLRNIISLTDGVCK